MENRVGLVGKERTHSRPLRDIRGTGLDRKACLWRVRLDYVDHVQRRDGPAAELAFAREPLAKLAADHAGRAGD
jgi:hypothetical protein